MTKQQTWWDTDPTWWTVTATVTDIDGTNSRKVTDRFYSTLPDARRYIITRIDRQNPNGYFIEAIVTKNK